MFCVTAYPCVSTCVPLTCVRAFGFVGCILFFRNFRPGTKGHYLVLRIERGNKDECLKQTRRIGKSKLPSHGRCWALPLLENRSPEKAAWTNGRNQATIMITISSLPNYFKTGQMVPETQRCEWCWTLTIYQHRLSKLEWNIYYMQRKHEKTTSALGPSKRRAHTPQ